MDLNFTKSLCRWLCSETNQQSSGREKTLGVKGGAGRDSNERVHEG